MIDETDKSAKCPIFKILITTGTVRFSLRAEIAYKITHIHTISGLFMHINEPNMQETTVSRVVSRCDTKCFPVWNKPDTIKKDFKHLFEALFTLVGIRTRSNWYYHFQTGSLIFPSLHPTNQQKSDTLTGNSPIWQHSWIH